MTSNHQPRSQGLSSYRLERAKRDPDTRWSRVSQNLGDDKKIITGMGGLVGNLSVLNLRSAGCVVTKINQERDDALIL